MLNSWAGDGNYWYRRARRSQLLVRHVRERVRARPGQGRQPLASQIHAATGGFVAGPAAIDGLVTAIKRANGSLKGSKLAAQMVKFHNVPTLSGLVSFSATAPHVLRPLSIA